MRTAVSTGLNYDVLDLVSELVKYILYYLSYVSINEVRRKKQPHDQVKLYNLALRDYLHTDETNFFRSSKFDFKVGLKLYG